MEDLRIYLKHLIWVDEDDSNMWSEQVQNIHPEKSLRITYDLIFNVYGGGIERKQKVEILAANETVGMIGHFDDAAGGMMPAKANKYEILKVEFVGD